LSVRQARGESWSDWPIQFDTNTLLLLKLIIPVSGMGGFLVGVEEFGGEAPDESGDSLSLMGVFLGQAEVHGRAETVGPKTALGGSRRRFSDSYLGAFTA